MYMYMYIGGALCEKTLSVSQEKDLDTCGEKCLDLRIPTYIPSDITGIFLDIQRVQDIVGRPNLVVIRLHFSIKQLDEC